MRDSANSFPKSSKYLVQLITYMGPLRYILDTGPLMLEIERRWILASMERCIGGVDLLEMNNLLLLLYYHLKKSAILDPTRPSS